jgi:hypothetical protein
MRAHAALNAQRLALATLLLLSLAAGCKPAQPEAVTAEGGALLLFATAKESEISEEQLHQLFGEVGDAGARAVLLDALQELSVAGDPQVVDLQELAALDRTVVDLEATLSGGGVASYSVQLQPTPAGLFRVTWFAGPGVEWPPPPRRRGQGMSSSHPPG